MSKDADIETIVQLYLDEIDKINMEFIGCTIGVAEAIGRSRTALDDIDQGLVERKYHTASQMGYGDITSNFIFLQRTLGALQNAYDNKTKLISEIAYQTKKAYEDVEPYVDAKIPAMQPRPPGGHKYDPATARQRVQDILNNVKDL